MAGWWRQAKRALALSGALALAPVLPALPVELPLRVPAPARVAPAPAKPVVRVPKLPKLTSPPEVEITRPAPVSLPAPPPVIATATPPAASTLALPRVPQTVTATARAEPVADPRPMTTAAPIRRLPGGGEVRVVPRDVCSTQVASAYPESPALCTTVTPDVAQELGLTPAPDPSPIGTLAVTGASIVGLALAALMFGLGGVLQPFRSSRARRRAAPA
jgi:hypothetical protein